MKKITLKVAASKKRRYDVYESEGKMEYYFDFTDYLVALYDTEKHDSTYHTFNTQKEAFDYMYDKTNDFIKAKIWRQYWTCHDEDGYVDEDKDMIHTLIFDNYTKYIRNK